MKNLVWVDWKDGSDLCIGYSDDAKYGKITEGPSMTLEMLADFCDQKAESCNAHEYVGAHRALAALLYRECQRVKATEIMRMIAERGGLNGMNGVFREKDSFSEFGIKGPWNDWNLGV